VAVRRETAAIVETAGSCIAPGAMLTRLVGALAGGTMVRLEDSGTGELAIYAGEGRYSLAIAFEAKDYPILPEIDNDLELVFFKYGLLRNAMQAVSFAAASSPGLRTMLYGVNFLAKNSDLQLSATDGHRISVFTVKGAETGELAFTVPSETVNELQKLGLADNDLVFLTQTKSHALFRTGEVSIITSLFADPYPEVSGLIPETCKNTILLKRQDLIEALERCLIVSNAASGQTGYVTISYAKETGDLSVASTNDAASAADTIATESQTSSENFTAKMNPRYLLDSLRHVEQNCVILGINTGTGRQRNNPGPKLQAEQFLIHGLGAENHRQLIMGMAP
jgi:hypothetical protein